MRLTASRPAFRPPASPTALAPSPVAPATLIRALKSATLELSARYGRIEALDGATALLAPDYADLEETQTVFDARREPRRDAAEFVATVEARFEAAGVRCEAWLPRERRFDPETGAALRAIGYVNRPELAMEWTPATGAAWPSNASAAAAMPLEIGSARDDRAAYARFRRDFCAHHWGEAHADRIVECSLAEAGHPALEMTVGRVEGEIAVAAGLMRVGEVGVTWDVATHPRFLRRGLMRALLRHVLNRCRGDRELAALALCVDTDNEPAITLYRSLGFVSLGDYDCYRRERGR